MNHDFKNYLKTIALSFLFMSNVHGANISITKKDIYKAANFRPKTPAIAGRCYDEITIAGDIVKGDALKLSEIYRQFESDAKKTNCWNERTQFNVFPRLEIRLNSKGGDLQEALIIGKFIRNNEFSTTVYSGDSCLSSCALIFGAGVMKMAFGSIGIHRPYFAYINPSSSRAQIQSERNKITEEVKKYAMEIDIPVSMIERMMSIPPESMEILNEGAINHYRLNGYDPSFEEKITASDAAYYNLTSLVYRQRKSKIEGQFGDIVANNFEFCEKSIMLGISIESARIRNDLARATCQKLEVKDRITCRRNIIVFGKKQ